MAKGEWKPTGKYSRITATRMCRQVEELTLWVKYMKALRGYPNKLPKVRPNGSASPPRFP
jgi:hypothetical protein